MLNRSFDCSRVPVEYHDVTVAARASMHLHFLQKACGEGSAGEELTRVSEIGPWSPVPERWTQVAPYTWLDIHISYLEVISGAGSS